MSYTHVTYRPSYLELCSKLNQIASAELSGEDQAMALQQLESALANAEGAQRILARWGELDAVVRRAQQFLRGVEGGADVAEEIDEVRKSIGGQP